jgi:hypothetical protein
MSKIDELDKRLRKIEQEREIQREVEIAIEHERSGIFKTIINFIKVITALILIFTAGDQAMETHWIKELIK